MTATLELPVLVLNKNWTPVRITTVQSAICKLFEGRAKAICPEDYQVYDFASWAELEVEKDKPFLTTCRSRMRVPEVIVSCFYGRLPDTKVAFSRENIYRRDKDTCQYCGRKPGRKELTIDHIVPRSRGGISSWTNCVLACIDCNKAKDDRLLSESGMRLKREPIKPTWSPRLVLDQVPNTPANWERFVSNAYWNSELKK
jgi:5-methylcytosine-specific restriction endonuclease McrA